MGGVSPESPLKGARSAPLLIAHRGAARWAPENTLAAFGLAIAAGADALETDLWRTRDGEWVCHHDRTLDRTTDGAGAIPELTLAEVKAARARGSYCAAFAPGAFDDQRVPTLEDLLALTPPDVGLALELKDPRLAEPDVTADLVARLGDRIAASTVMLLSFAPERLHAARAAAPGIWIGLIREHDPDPRFDGDGIGTTPGAMAENPCYVAEAHARGLWVCPLDPAPEPRLAAYLATGVDGLLTHDPAATRAALDALKEATMGEDGP